MVRKKVKSKKEPKSKKKSKSPIGTPIESQVMVKNDKGDWIGSPDTDIENPLMHSHLEDNKEDPRRAARMARQANKMKQNGTSTDNVVPIKKAEKVSGGTPNLLDIKMGENLKVPIPEVLKWKMLLLEKERNEAVNVIKDTLKSEYQEKLNIAIAEAINNDKNCVEKTRAQNLCVNEILDAIDPELPEGYAVVSVRTQEGYAECVYKPDQVGKRMAT